MTSNKALWADETGIHMGKPVKVTSATVQGLDTVLEVDITVRAYSHFPMLEKAILLHLKDVKNALRYVVKSTTAQEEYASWPVNSFESVVRTTAVTEVNSNILLPYTDAPIVKSLLESYAIYHKAQTGFTFEYEVSTFTASEYNVRHEAKIFRGESK